MTAVLWQLPLKVKENSMNTDPIADMLTRIRNANVVSHPSVELPSSKLKVALAKLLKEEGMDEEYRLNSNKYLQRFLHPFVCILLAVLGAILGFSKPREQRLIGFVIAIGFIFAYYVTLPFFDYLAEKGVFPPFFTAIFPLLAFLCAIIAFYKSKEL